MQIIEAIEKNQINKFFNLNSDNGIVKDTAYLDVMRFFFYHPQRISELVDSNVIQQINDKFNDNPKFFFQNFVFDSGLNKEIIELHKGNPTFYEELQKHKKSMLGEIYLNPETKEIIKAIPDTPEDEQVIMRRKPINYERLDKTVKEFKESDLDAVKEVYLNNILFKQSHPTENFYNSNLNETIKLIRGLHEEEKDLQGFSRKLFQVSYDVLRGERLKQPINQDKVQSINDFLKTAKQSEMNLIFKYANTDKSLDDKASYYNANFCLDLDGNILVAPAQDENGQSIHHTDLTKGKPVLSAGQMLFNDKKELVAVSNSSGHYRPSVESIIELKEPLANIGIDLYKVIIFDNSNNPSTKNTLDELEIAKRKQDLKETINFNRGLDKDIEPEISKTLKKSL